MNTMLVRVNLQTTIFYTKQKVFENRTFWPLGTSWFPEREEKRVSWIYLNLLCENGEYIAELYVGEKYTLI